MLSLLKSIPVLRHFQSKSTCNPFCRKCKWDSFSDGQSRRSRPGGSFQRLVPPVIQSSYVLTWTASPPVPIFGRRWLWKREGGLLHMLSVLKSWNRPKILGLNCQLWIVTPQNKSPSFLQCFLVVPKYFCSEAKDLFFLTNRLWSIINNNADSTDSEPDRVYFCNVCGLIQITNRWKE